MTPLRCATTVLLLALLVAGCRGRTEPRPLEQSGAASAAGADPFTDVTEAAGIDYRLTPATLPMRIVESTGSGCAFLDYDGDGHLDLLLIGTPRCGLFRNRGNGTFEDVTQAANLAKDGVWIGCAVGDIDNDGDSDLLLTGYRNRALYLNDGHGRFEEITAASGLKETPWSTVATFADFDRDGSLDLYIGAYADFGPHTKQYCHLRENHIRTSCRPIDYDPIIGQGYRGRGDGTFEDVTRKWGLDRAHGRTLGATVADYDRDGWPDLFLANDELEADLFRNEEGRGFKNVAVAAGAAYGTDGAVMGGMGVDWGDYDNDGWPDLLVGTYEAEGKPLFRNVQGSAFESATGAARVLADAFPYVVWGSLLFDYDNDGWLDLMYVNGHVYDNIQEIVPTSSFRQPALLFRNRHDGLFEPVSSSTLAVPRAGRGLACGDYDNDGDPDLLILDIDGKARLLRNDATEGNHWLGIRTRGTSGNRDGLGAVVSVTAGGLTQRAEVRTARSYASACDPRLYFGLGNAERVEKVEIRWPGGGVTRLSDVTPDRVLEVSEQEKSDEP